MRTIRLAMTGFGNVGTGIARLLLEHADRYRSELGVQLRLVGVADRGGGAVSADGLDLGQLLDTKRVSGTVAASNTGQEGLEGSAFLDATSADVLLETASTNFRDAEPGYSYAVEAMQRHMDVVLASKGALTIHWAEMMERAAAARVQLRFSATIGAPLPSLDVAGQSLPGVTISGFDGIVNGTSNVILGLMAEGASYDEGVRRAQEIGIAETDPTLDVDGWDAAAKVVIMANATMGGSLTLSDVQREGIRGVTADMLQAALSRGERVKLIASCRKDGQHLAAAVRPESRPFSDPLGRLEGGDMGIVFYTDYYGNVTSTCEKTDHQGALPTSMTVLRDVFSIARGGQ